jgi:hypothetical protein
MADAKEKDTKEADVIPAGFLRAGSIRPAVKEEADETPSPTQAEIDATKLGRKPEVEKPEVEKLEVEPETTKQIEAKPAASGYQTRQARPAKSHEE